MHLEISGNTLKNVLPIPETVIHSGDNIWFVSDKNTLDIKKITPVWQEQGLAFIPADQLPENARIISSSLSTPVQNMTVRIQTSNQE